MTDPRSTRYFAHLRLRQRVLSSATPSVLGDFTHHSIKKSKSGGEILLRADGRPASATRWPPLALPQIPVLSSWAAPAGPVRHCRESEDLRTAQGRGGPEGFRALAERPGARGQRCCSDQG